METVKLDSDSDTRVPRLLEWRVEMLPAAFCSMEQIKASANLNREVAEIMFVEGGRGVNVVMKLFHGISAE